MAKKKYKDQFANIPQELKDMVAEATKTYVAPRVKKNEVQQPLVDEETLKQINEIIEREKKLFKKKPEVVINSEELKQMKRVDREKAAKRLELISINSKKVEEEKKEEESNHLSELEKQLNDLVPTKTGIWDFSINDDIPFFDITLSYELTGYKPINEIEGLDFDPEWFIEARRKKESTGYYINKHESGKKAYDDFWLEEYNRLNNGMTINGYTITGDHYFFLNYYQIMNTGDIQYAGQGRLMGFADFYVAQYEYFHYVELCKKLRKNAISLKGRGLNSGPPYIVRVR